MRELSSNHQVWIYDSGKVKVLITLVPSLVLNLCDVTTMYTLVQ